MAGKKRYATGSKTKVLRKRPDSPGKRLLLALTLVPLVIGGLMILGWALDISLWEEPNTQIYIGVMFILGSFVVSNALQSYWYAAGGWALLLVADTLLLLYTNLALQVAAFILGGAGLVLLGLEFAQRWRSRKRPTAST